MLFHSFSSQEERREFGGSYFIEMQFCRMPLGTEIAHIVSTDAITHWKNDSLYIYGDDDNEFISYYGKIFTDGTYNNLTRGAADLCGINYYSPGQTARILDQVEKKKPPDHQILLRWLEGSKEHNGVYILGL